VLLYFDENVSHSLITLLQHDNHRILTAGTLGLSGRRSDIEQLITATEQSALLITHNTADFKLLHLAWYALAQRWGSAEQHAGILILRQLPTKDLHQPLASFLNARNSLRGTCWTWFPPAGWVRYG
jgi:hypothetical protein